MRRALVKYQPITTEHGEPGYGYFGKHAGYDYGIVRQPVVAPEAGTIINTKIAPNADGGNIVELRSSKYDHRFLHLDSINVKKGQKVKEGQRLGYSGNTGNVGFHLHHDTRKKGTAWTDSYANYVDWEKLLKQGDDMYKNKSAKYWYDQSVKYRNAWKKETTRRAQLWDKIKGLFNK